MEPQWILTGFPKGFELLPMGFEWISNGCWKDSQSILKGSSMKVPPSIHWKSYQNPLKIEAKPFGILPKNIKTNGFSMVFLKSGGGLYCGPLSFSGSGKMAVPEKIWRLDARGTDHTSHSPPWRGTQHSPRAFSAPSPGTQILLYVLIPVYQGHRSW